jgi:MarR family 2-MHQ and catechol resistance regulon transcriptional repressor
MKTKSILSDRELRDFRAALRELVRKIGRQLREETQCCGVGYLTCHVLLELEAGAGRSLKELEDSLGTDKAALSRAVELLVRDGLVSRRENPADRRAIVIELTAAGRKKVGAINAYTDEKYRGLFACIPAGQHAAVLSTVEYLARAFDELCGDSGSCSPRKKGRR